MTAGGSDALNREFEALRRGFDLAGQLPGQRENPLHQLAGAVLQAVETRMATGDLPQDTTFGALWNEEAYQRVLEQGAGAMVRDRVLGLYAVLLVSIGDTGNKTTSVMSKET